MYYVFDILYYDGHDLMDEPLMKRKAFLQQTLPQLPHIAYADHLKTHGIAMFRQTTQLGLEGIMAKKADSPYKMGGRSKSWLKMKSMKRQEVVIGGFTRPKGMRNHFGALLIGVYKGRKLTYVGHVGGGFDEDSLESIYKLLKPLEIEDCPFETKPQTNTPATWVKPKILAEVTFSEWTKDDIMRHPIFIGLREDKKAEEVEKEDSSTLNQRKTSKAKPVDEQDLEFSNLSKIFWPKEKYTKRDLINYYREVAPIILPYLKDRPESLLRYPNGIFGKSFYQKDASLLNVDWIPTIPVYSDSNQKEIEYLLCQNKATLLYLANLGCIDLNPWNSRVGSLENPDYLLIDLDPEEADFSAVIQTALTCRTVLEQLDIPSFPKTSGATGMHIYVPLGAQYSYEQTRQLAELLCIQVHAKIPDITSLKRSPKDRHGLVYLDYLQNRVGQTLASVYSVRAKPGATVSTPLLWSEVNKKLRPTQFTIKNTMNRIHKHGDLFKGVLGTGIDMGKVLGKIEKLP
jgi:bifunctional non-homologous end joining protein LigD